jgi:hypothetical protein
MVLVQNRQKEKLSKVILVQLWFPQIPKAVSHWARLISVKDNQTRGKHFIDISKSIKKVTNSECFKLLKSFHEI